MIWLISDNKCKAPKTNFHDIMLRNLMYDRALTGKHTALSQKRHSPEAWMPNLTTCLLDIESYRAM